MSSVRAYYEQNTRFFLAFGVDNQTRTIHRAVWAQGIHTTAQALNYTNQLLLQALQPLTPPWCVADLGCGVGGSLFYLAQHAPQNLTGFGLTLSPTQAKLAHQHNTHHNLFLEGDYLQLPFAQTFEAAFSIEAFIHAPHPAQYFREVARTLKPHGRLILCDDFISERTDLTQADHYWLTEFKDGWHAPHVQTITQVTQHACACGLELVANQHLTPYLKLLKLPAPLAYAFMHTSRFIRTPLWLSLTGGLALQVCLAKGLVEYRFLVFEKNSG